MHAPSYNVRVPACINEYSLCGSLNDNQVSTDAIPIMCTAFELSIHLYFPLSMPCLQYNRNEFLK